LNHPVLGSLSLGL